MWTEIATANTVLIVHSKLGACAHARHPDVNNPPSSQFEGFFFVPQRLRELLGTCFECDQHQLINTD